MGESGVGKTSLLCVYNSDTFPDANHPTIGVELSCKIETMSDGSKLKIQVFDTAGQEKYRSIISNYCRKALGCLLMFDITNYESFKLCYNFIEEVKKISEPECVFILVGNKCDLGDKRQVNKDEAEFFAKKYNIGYIETSAKAKVNVNEAFKILLESKENFFI